jgi:type II secretory pathway pseudopilin PulG
MLKLKHKLKLAKPEEGFSILEVLVTALITVFFLLGALQAITLATLLRVKAQIKTEAVNWINSDLEEIKYRAYLLDFDTSTNTHTPDTSPGEVCDTNTYATRLRSNLTGTSPTFPASGTTVSLFNRTYQLSRTYTANDNVLQIRWQIWDEGGTVDNSNNPDEFGNPTGGDTDDKSIAIVTTDVLPNAVLNCY